MDEKTLAILLDALDKVGYTGESAGVATLFQHFATIMALLGTTGDGAGSGSVFARLAQIAGYTDQVEGYVDTLETKVGVNTDAAGSTTLFARLAQIAGYIDTLETNLGLIADTANAAGTALARLAYLASQKSRINYSGDYATTQIDYVAALSVSGKGVLRGVTIDSRATIQLVIDGTTYALGSGYGVLTLTSSGLDFTTTNNAGFLDINFNTSLVINIKADSGYTGNVAWLYQK